MSSSLLSEPSRLSLQPKQFPNTVRQPILYFLLILLDFSLLSHPFRFHLSCCYPGISADVLPSSIQPPALLVLFSHCLKKNGTCFKTHWSLMSRIHWISMGRAPSPLSPPTTTQLMPKRSNSPTGPRRGSKTFEVRPTLTS